MIGFLTKSATTSLEIKNSKGWTRSSRNSESWRKPIDTSKRIVLSNWSRSLTNQRGWSGFGYLVWISFNLFDDFYSFINLCLADHQDHHDTLTHLVEVTEELVRNHVQESVWIVSATAQRVNADEKVKSCIAWALCWDFSSIELTLRLSCSIGIKSTYHPSHLFSQCSNVLIRVLARPRGRHLLF